MITSGWLVCFECEGSGWIGLMENLMVCPECDGSGQPVPGSYEVDSEDDDFDHSPPGYDASDFARDR